MMIKQTLKAGALTLLVMAMAGPASAVPLAKPEAQTSDVTKIRQGGPGFGGGGGFKPGPGFGGGGGFKPGPGFGGGGRFKPGPGFGGGRPHIGRPYHHHKHRPKVRIFPYYYGYAPYYSYYYDDDYYYDDCAWLRRKALATNSRYWWRRYRACRAAY